MEVNGTKNSLITIILQNIILYVPQKKYVWEQHEGEQMMTAFSVFGWTITISIQASKWMQKHH